MRGFTQICISHKNAFEKCILSNTNVFLRTVSSSFKCSTHLCQLDVALTKTNVAGTARQEEGSDNCGLSNDDVDWVKNTENEFEEKRDLR